MLNSCVSSRLLCIRLLAVSLYTNLSSSPEEGRDPAVTHSMSQDRADLVRQSSGSLYGQVYDVFLGETATGNIV